MYKIIALDMDETLLQPNKTISKEDKEALQKAMNMGIHIVLATGRPVFGIKKYIDELGIPNNGYVVCFNGAEVKTIDGTKRIYTEKLTGADLVYLKTLAKNNNVFMHCIDDDGSCFSECHSTYTDLECTLNGITLNVVDYNTVAIDHVITKIMHVDEPSVLDESIKKLPKEVYEKYNVVKSAPFFLEFLNPKADKWYGIEALANYLGVKNEEIMCFGDEENDFMMVKNAGMGIAMGNGIEKLKNVAKFVTVKNYENGVAYALNKFIFNEK